MPNVLRVCVRCYNFALNQILEEIEEAIEDPYSLKKSIVRDLHQLKTDFRLKMAEMMDEFSFKILSNIERDME